MKKDLVFVQGWTYCLGTRKKRATTTTMQTTFKGTDTVSSILATFGKIKTNGTKPFSVTFEVTSKMVSVAVPAAANKEDKETALATLTASEQATLAKLLSKLKAEESRLAKARVSGQTSERWTTTGIATLG